MCIDCRVYERAIRRGEPSAPRVPRRDHVASSHRAYDHVGFVVLVGMFLSIMACFVAGSSAFLSLGGSFNFFRVRVGRP